MWRRLTVVLAVVLAEAWGALHLGTVAATPSRPESGQLATMADPDLQDASAAVAADWASAAVAHGWDAADVAMLTSTEAALDALITVILDRHPGTIAGSVLPRNPHDPAVLYVTGTAADDTRRMAALAGVVVVDGQRYAIEDTDVRLHEVQQALAAATIEDVAGWADVERDGAIVIAVGQHMAARAAAALAGVSGLTGGDIRIIESPTAVVADDGAFGGMRLLDSGAFLCTSGWTVEKLSSGVRGVSTAGHCLDNVDQISHPGHGVHAAVAQQGHVGEWGDVEWLTTGEAEADDFYADEATIRDVSAVALRATISINEPICFYGRASNERNCTLIVENPNVFCGIGPQKLVQMNGAVAIGGDSGGGWSWGGTAYGSHKGKCWSKDSFSVADLYDEALGVFVPIN